MQSRLFQLTSLISSPFYRFKNLNQLNRAFSYTSYCLSSKTYNVELVPLNDLVGDLLYTNRDLSSSSAPNGETICHSITGLPVKFESWSDNEADFLGSLQKLGLTLDDFSILIPTRSADQIWKRICSPKQIKFSQGTSQDLEVQKLGIKQSSTRVKAQFSNGYQCFLSQLGLPAREDTFSKGEIALYNATSQHLIYSQHILLLLPLRDYSQVRKCRISNRKMYQRFHPPPTISGFTPVTSFFGLPVKTSFSKEESLLITTALSLKLDVFDVVSIAPSRTISNLRSWCRAKGISLEKPLALNLMPKRIYPLDDVNPYTTKKMQADHPSFKGKPQTHLSSLLTENQDFQGTGHLVEKLKDSKLSASDLFYPQPKQKTELSSTTHNSDSSEEVSPGDPKHPIVKSKNRGPSILKKFIASEEVVENSNEVKTKRRSKNPPWSLDELTRLEEGIHRYGLNAFFYVAFHVRTRNPASCKLKWIPNRYLNSIVPLKRFDRTFNPEESVILERLILKGFRISFIAGLFPGFSVNQVMLRYKKMSTQFLVGSIDKDIDRVELCELFLEMGADWDGIAKSLSRSTSARSCYGTIHEFVRSNITTFPECLLLQDVRKKYFSEVVEGRIIRYGMDDFRKTFHLYKGLSTQLSDKDNHDQQSSQLS